MKLTGVFAPPGTITLLAGQEYGLCQLRVGHDKAVGVGSCEGCNVPTCIAVSRFSLKYRGARAPEYFDATGLNSVTWQGGYVASYDPESGPCPDPSLCPNRLQCTLPPVPARGRTWGTIKSMYR